MNSGANTNRVLVVDDEPSVCDLIGRALSTRNMNCALVTDPAIADRLLKTEHFGAIICDVAMPGLGGLEILQRAKIEQPRTPVILMTGRGTVEDAKYAIRHGAYDYLEKPVEIHTLCRHIERAIEESAATSQAGPRQAGQVDCLTGLLTPRHFHEQLSKVRLASVADRRNCSMLVLDIDDFADANGIFGYAFGDEILCAVAKSLQNLFGPAAPICRMSSDEFIVVLPENNEQQSLNLAELARKTIGEFSLSWQNHPVSLTASIGVAEAEPGFGIPEEQLLANARRALREAKRAGGNAVRAYGQLEQSSAGQVDLVVTEMHNMAEEAAKIDHELRLACLESVRALVSAVEAKDPYTRRHSDQVAYYAEHFATFVNLPGDMIETVRVAAMVHDVGKIGIPDTVLTKPGRLTDSEYALIKSHPAIGSDILQKISMLGEESTLVRAHHEHWDGSGYPDGLAGEDIPVGARIITLADSIDAMLMRRTYKEPFSVSRVLKELHRCKGMQFDPDFTDAVIQWMNEYRDKVIQPEPQAESA